MGEFQAVPPEKLVAGDLIRIEGISGHDPLDVLTVVESSADHLVVFWIDNQGIRCNWTLSGDDLDQITITRAEVD